MKKNNKEYSIPKHGLNEKQKLEADEELRRLRFESLSNISDQQKIYADLISLKFRSIDYIQNGIFSETFLFSEFLKRYVAILNISRRKLADDLGVH